MPFLSEQKLQNLQEDKCRVELVNDERFRNLLPAKEWCKMPIAIRDRFSQKAARGGAIIYRGRTTRLRINWLGKILAQLGRAIGAPLPLGEDEENRSAIVAITYDPRTDGQIWTRLYGRGIGFPQSVNSSKRFSGPTGLEEHVGGGFVITLTLQVKENALFFKGQQYFLNLFGLRLRLPSALSPGKMVVGHHDLGNGTFLFTLNLTHRFFGQLIDQETVFHDMEVSAL